MFNFNYKVMNQKINEIEVNGIKYVPKDSVIPVEHTGEIKIVVLQRGWVYIGRMERDGNECKLHSSYNIRRWGTKNGLPELVGGKLSETILDRCEGVVEFDWRTVINTITVNQSEWKKLIF